MLSIWRPVNQRVVFDDGMVRVDERLSKSSTGYGRFSILRFPDWVSVIALTDQNEVILVNQFRHGHGQTMSEFPAGKVEPGEDPLNAAKRELAEETGFSSDDWMSLGSIRPNAAMQDNCFHAFAARSVVPGRQDLDEGEDIEVSLVPLQSIPSMFRDGALPNGLCHAAFMLFMLSITKKPLI